MQKRHKILGYMLILFLVFSCSLDTNVATYTVLQGDFTNMLMVEGAVEPVLTTTLTSPRRCDGVVQYLVEDGVYVEKDENLLYNCKY